ncbi:MAG: immunoglobulin domain-containing protein [Planctomycetota bacterium]
MTRTSRPGSLLALAGSILAASAVLGAAQSAHAQHWDRVLNPAPGAINLMLLLSDGTVMASANDGSDPIGNAWYRLTPDIHGNYVDGTWAPLAPMLDTRLNFQAQVLRDGRVFVSGGEFGTGGSAAEIYDPTTNVWTALSVPPALWTPGVNSFSDGNSKLLPDGSVLLMPVSPHQPGVPLRYDPATNVWSNAGHLFRGTGSGATWVKLPDNSILTIDPAGTLSERYIPATNTWINDGVVPVSLYDSFGFNMGGGVVLPNGKAFFLGATGHTALYTPSGTTAPGIWVAGPDIPGGMGTPDAPCAMMANGKVLCVASDAPTAGDHFPERVSYFEFDPTTNTFAQISNASGGSTNIPTNIAAMLALPDGSVLLSRRFANTSVWIPLGDPLPAWKPTINAITMNPDGSYHLTGTQLNGMSEGASYGNELQMSSNYPIVRLTGSTGNVYYARTFDWSSTGVQTGSEIVSTEFTVPAALPPDNYTPTVSASGINSDPFCVAPSIAQSSSSQNACQGGSVSFGVVAGGVSTLTYQWRRGLVNLSNTGEFSGVTTATLTISPATATDIGADYNCVVTNACGSETSSPIALFICAADFDCDGTVDFFDYDSFVVAFETGDPQGDFDADGTIDFFDYDAFVVAFEAGC